MGTLNYLTSALVTRAATLVKSGRSISMAIPINTIAGPDNSSPAIHHMTQLHDWDIGSGTLRFASDFLGINFHGDCHTHIDALCHLAYADRLYGDRPASSVTSHGARTLAIDDYAHGITGRGVLLDIPRLRDVPYLEPGEAVTRAELEEAERAQDVRLEEGDIFVFRTGHHRRRLERGPWDNGYTGEGKAGLHVDTIPWMHERKIAMLHAGRRRGDRCPARWMESSSRFIPFRSWRWGMAVSDSLNLRGYRDGL